ncbi:MAG: branched-chain amino acid permease [Alphaproteobacteria bacterium]|nr:branched-chain amino acid permease [Alphaproteobacteria bacterium]|tara:strand:- start:257 stop:997 length:741 start_codon:yes stop_codon:yes gene_type:complete
MSMNAGQQDPLSTGQAVRLGVRDAFGAPFIVLLASMTAFGSLARDSGLSIEIAVVSTLGIWALPGQIVFAELHAAGSEAVALILAVSLANARFFPMVMSILPLMRGDDGRTTWLYLYAQLLSAQTWAYCRRVFPRLPVHARCSYFLAFALSILGISVSATALGYVLTGTLPRPLALSLVLINPIFMLLLLADSRSHSVIFALVAGVVIGPAMHLVAPNWGLLMTGILAGSIGFAINQILVAKRGER